MISHNRKPGKAVPQPAAADFDNMPVTQQLVLDALAARYRTGEKLFVLPAKAVKAAHALEQLGLIWVTSGNVEHSIRAGLTDAGIKATISPTYTTPIERELLMVRAQLKEIRELRALEADHRSGPNW